MRYKKDAWIAGGHAGFDVFKRCSCSCLVNCLFCVLHVVVFVLSSKAVVCAFDAHVGRIVARGKIEFRFLLSFTISVSNLPLGSANMRGSLQVRLSCRFNLAEEIVWVLSFKMFLLVFRDNLAESRMAHLGCGQQNGFDRFAQIFFYRLNIFGQTTTRVMSRY